MNTLLWAVQIILAIKFALMGYTHLFRTSQPQWQAGVRQIDAQARRGLKIGGICSGLGVGGLLLPAATGVLPWFTPLSAALLAVLMLRGIFFHRTCRTHPNVVPGLVLAALAVFVAYGRWMGY